MLPRECHPSILAGASRPGPRASETPNRWRREGRFRSFADLTESIVEGAARRIRPKLMTVMVLLLGLMPLMWSTGTGADVMKRIAAPMVGGIVTSFLLQLTVYPAVFAVWKGRAVEERTREEEAS